MPAMAPVAGVAVWVAIRDVVAKHGVSSELSHPYFAGARATAVGA